MKSKVKFLFTVTAVLMLFAATGVMAQEAYCPDTCTAGPYTITFNGVFPATCKDAAGLPTPCYDFSYSISGTTTIFNQAVALVPVCCDSPLTIYPGCSFPIPCTPPCIPQHPLPCAQAAEQGDFGYNPSKIYPPGTGDPSGFGLGIGMVYALRSEPAGTLPTPDIFTSSPLVGPISMQFKVASKYYYCANILGPRCPDCGKEAHIPSVVEKLIRVESGCVKLSITSDKCVQSLSLCNADCGNCVAQEAVYLTTTSDDGRITDETLREISDTDGNQRCAWGRIYIGDHTCQSVPSGTPGKYFLWGDTCKCTSTTQCYPPKTCQGGICKNPL